MSTQQSATQIPAHLVKELRERTGAGFSDCRAALGEAAGDVGKGINILGRTGPGAPAEEGQRGATRGGVGSHNYPRGENRGRAGEEWRAGFLVGPEECPA